LSWLSCSGKREAYRRAFAEFDPRRSTRFTEKVSSDLLQDEGIIRNWLKITDAVNNARFPRCAG